MKSETTKVIVTVKNEIATSTEDGTTSKWLSTVSCDLDEASETVAFYDGLGYKVFVIPCDNILGIIYENKPPENSFDADLRDMAGRAFIELYKEPLRNFQSNWSSEKLTEDQFIKMLVEMGRKITFNMDTVMANVAEGLKSVLNDSQISDNG